MKKYLILLIVFFSIASSSIFALNRDYKSECDEDQFYQNYYSPYCPWHVPVEAHQWIPTDLTRFIPETGQKCSICQSPSIYLGYIDPDFQKYHAHFKQQLYHCDKHRKCDCYWPEYSSRAAQISDIAYLLFKDLILTTSLSTLLTDEKEQKAWMQNPGWFLNRHGLTIAFIVHQFRFSDYYHVCKDIENYAALKYSVRDAEKIKDKLGDILEALYPKFFALHTSCYAKHPCTAIENEIRLMKLLVRDLSGFNKKFSIPFSENIENINLNGFDEFVDNSIEAELLLEYENDLKTQVIDFSEKFAHSENDDFAIPFSTQSEILLEQGSILNDLLIHKGAIKVLTEAIKLNHSNRNAYIERATAYFETNHLNLALKDYEKAQQLSIVFPLKLKHQLIMIYVPENKTGFAKGLVAGIIEGASISGQELVPSIIDSCRGIINCLWAFALSPVDVSQEMVNATYAMGEYVASHSTMECLECVVPELRELSLAWNIINDREKGKKIGYIIGKYGVDVFAPIAAIKAVNKVRALKRANTMCTLQGCAASQAQRKKIINESLNRASMREVAVAESLKNGKILVRNFNTQIHIMQSKHAWDKLIKISGNVEEDCKNVIRLLEENKIYLKKYNRDLFKFEKHHRYDNKMKINDFEVKAIFNENIETGELFLNDAWVVKE